MNISKRGLSIVVIVVAVAGALVLFSQVDTEGDEAALRQISRDHTSDNTRAEGAPQQQVVNGWTTHSYLELIAQQQLRTQRTLAWGLATLIAVTVLASFATGRASRDPAREKGQPDAPGPLTATEPPPPLTDSTSD